VRRLWPAVGPRATFTNGDERAMLAVVVPAIAAGKAVEAIGDPT